MRTKDNSSTPEQNLLYNYLNRAGISFDSFFPIQTDIKTEHGSLVYYFPDCRISATKILIEVKGGVHKRMGVRKKDDKREKWLAQHYWQVMSFTNSDVRRRPSVVVAEICREIEDPQPPKFIEEISR